MNALEAIRAKEAIYRQEMIGLEAQIESNRETGHRDLALMESYEKAKARFPVSRCSLYEDHGKPGIEAFLAPYEDDLAAARKSYMAAFERLWSALLAARKATAQWEGITDYTYLDVSKYSIVIPKDYWADYMGRVPLDVEPPAPCDDVPVEL